MNGHRVKSDDAEICYHVLGEGRPVVLLHPFPSNHEFWLPVTAKLSTRYRLILPDLRGHGESGVGEGAATMEKHAADVARVMDDAEVGRAPLIGVSIGGYLLFEFWRRYRGRVGALGLFNTKAQADNTEARAGRLQTANDVLEQRHGTIFRKYDSKSARPNDPRIAAGSRRRRAGHDAQDVRRRRGPSTARYGVPSRLNGDLEHN